jgi:hypothetical protein
VCLSFCQFLFVTCKQRRQLVCSYASRMCAGCILVLPVSCIWDSHGTGQFVDARCEGHSWTVWRGCALSSIWGSHGTGQFVDARCEVRLACQHSVQASKTRSPPLPGHLPPVSMGNLSAERHVLVALPAQLTRFAREVSDFHCVSCTLGG